MRDALTSLLWACLLACAPIASQPAVPPPDAPIARAPGPVDESSGAGRPPSCTGEPGICLSVEPRDAEIIVNGESKGRVHDYAGAGGFLALPPGIYQITLTAEGHLPWRAEVAIKALAEPLEVTLERRPDRSDPQAP